MLYKSLGVVSHACKKAEIARKTHYEWINTDPEYKAEVENMPDFVLDFAENALFKLIEEKNPQATMFYLKTKGKKRDYVERQEIEANIDMTQPVVINIIKPDEPRPKPKTKASN